METAKIIAQVLSGLLVPIIAIFGAYIAWRQHQTARDKLKLDLYDRRFSVYRGLMDLIGAVLQDGNISQEALNAYYVESNAKQFLFDTDVIEYMVEIREKPIDLR